jgi:hypothetical protein
MLNPSGLESGWRLRLASCPFPCSRLSHPPVPSVPARRDCSAHLFDQPRVPRRVSTRVPCPFRGRRDHLYLRSRVASLDSWKQTRDVLCALRPQSPLPDLVPARPHQCPSRRFTSAISRRVPARAQQAHPQESGANVASIAPGSRASHECTLSGVMWNPTGEVSGCVNRVWKVRRRRVR